MRVGTERNMRSLDLDPSLLTAARTGDAAARERLLDAVLPVVLTWCARLGGPKVDPEDAAHDVGLVLLTHLRQIREPDRFPAWLFGTTRRVLAQHRRRAWLRFWAPAPAWDTSDPTADPSRDAEAAQTSRRVQRALEDLPAAQREVLVLFDLEERTEAEVADLLDIPLGTARSRLRLAREGFRRAVRRHHLHTTVVELPNQGHGDA
jgi:RNA polymerase sigma-70 factor (ECF subfamily)